MQTRHGRQGLVDDDCVEILTDPRLPGESVEYTACLQAEVLKICSGDYRTPTFDVEEVKGNLVAAQSMFRQKCENSSWGWSDVILARHAMLIVICDNPAAYQGTVAGELAALVAGVRAE